MKCRTLALAFVLTSAASALAAQGTCDIRQLPGRPAPNSQIVGSATYMSGRALYVCDNGISFQADSAVSAFGRRILIGAVIFEDPDRTVRAARMEYEERTGLVVAQGDVTVIEKKSGNRLRAPTGVTYNRATRNNPEARMNVYSGRPTLTLYGEGEKKDTTQVVSDRMEMIGDRYFRGFGNVTINRGTLDARGGEALMLSGGDTISLWRQARIKNENFTLDADSIYGVTEADEFRELRAFRETKLDSEDMDVTSHRMRILLDSGVVNRLIAIGITGPTATSGQARVLATDFNLVADSIDALMPGEKIEKVTAVGRALGERAMDSLDVKLPELIRRDWLRGDTVIATFVEAPDSIKRRRAAADSANDRIMDRLVAIGAEKPATALYRMRSEGDTTGVPQVSYITAKRITATFKDGEVHDVDADQEIKGLYLQPKADPKKPPATTTPPRRGQR